MNTRGPQFLVAFGVAAAGLLAEPAGAEKAMFRIQRRFLDGAGERTSPLQPSLGLPACGQGGSMGTPPTCDPIEVGTTSPAARFVIPAKNFYHYEAGTSVSPFPGSGDTTSSSSWVASSYNGRGRFSPNNPYGAAAYRRVYFPTTGANAPPHEGQGGPLTPTTTFAGDFDFSRAGSMKIRPGPNRFGGTIQFLFGPKARVKVRARIPFYYSLRSTGTFDCRMTAGSGPGARHGPLQACTSYGESKLGVIGSSGVSTHRWYSSSGNILLKATKAYWLSTFAPWTTGSVSAQNPLNQGFTPGGAKVDLSVQEAGYNESFSPPVTRTFSYAHYNTTPLGSTTTTMTQKQLKGITRITSMVRPRLRHTYFRPDDPANAIRTPFQLEQIWNLRVYFLPEPSGLLLLGAGILTLAGLSILRRR